MENSRMVEKKKKNINVIDRFFKKHFSSIYIIRLILNLVLLNILVIYFVIHFFFNQSTQNRMNSSENFNNLYFFKTVQKNEETYGNVIYVISIIYIILSLAFFILEFYIKWRKNNELEYMIEIEGNQISENKQKKNESKISNKTSTHNLPYQNKNYEHILEDSKTLNTNHLKDRNKQKNAHTNIHITTNYIFVYTLLMLLGIRQYNITEYVLYFFFILAICELSTPLTISMKLIHFITKYYKINFLKRGKKSNNSGIMIKKKDIYFFWGYFVILRFLKKINIYDKIIIIIKKSKPVYESDLKNENSKIVIKNNYIFYYYFIIFSFFKKCITYMFHILRRWMYNHIKTKDEKKKNINETESLLRNIENMNTDVDKIEINYNDNLKKKINIYNTVVYHFNVPNKNKKNNNICNKNKITKINLENENSGDIKKDDIKLNSSDKIANNLSMKKNELNKIIKNTNKYKDYYIKYNKYNKTISDMDEEEFEFENEKYFVNKNFSMIEKRQFNVIENKNNEIHSNDINKYEEKSQKKKKKNINPKHLELKHIYEQNKDNSLYFSNTSSTQVNEKETTEVDPNEENISYIDQNDFSTKFYNNYMVKYENISKKYQGQCCNPDQDISYSYNNKCINKEENIDNNYFSKTELGHVPSLNINKRNTICTHRLTYKIKKHNLDKKNISFEKNVKRILSNFKKRMEVWIFLNAIYKIALLLNILIIFFVMSIMLNINLYIFTTNVNSFFFYKMISILIQCCYFVFFHLYVYEYNNIIK
ncbi:conserved Plasmodium protein, unknown function [Plasmodium berghei]|uniref:Uncharacterized protein n=2 Tax=Plasmodium berghei TaxID=5821 RepID=A0A509AHM1_PLABA|nr:conserved Plasmodium protein, unknown function [Plasmodium berghei ANKA]CXI19903.1 conserved Plasmodium protein, unknown function [Plasmodium berghei]SCM19888.1 conserved Plasmodium protein, unknown function [Plasmodium berghei]SCN23612.1 conserved Plasmodium protein, unknown function [Plasmodium berghei]SCO59177.1 conserved Plasmodium protein, unknown function [Plasmodium berghei]SCO59983.1 conserved Plasmodium protein, unknown function [Plasmodium berghei]|eukprot:XP_034420690.1 conserved Plasmodium protein, unknown function [Plasmodium berghei ANKA]